MHGVWDAMDLAGNAEDCAPPPENYKPCNLAGKACSVTGCRPIKKLKNKFSYVSELPTKLVFIFFAWLVVFVKKSACIMEKGMVD